MMSSVCISKWIVYLYLFTKLALSYITVLLLYIIHTLTYTYIHSSNKVKASKTI